MTNPKSSDVLKVIENFRKVLPRATLLFNLDMRNPKVNNDYQCGTVHCHAGWYAVAVCDLSRPISFSAGVVQLVEDLGFSSVTELVSWAMVNVEIWGNTKGGLMFEYESAFYHEEKRPRGALTLQDIIDHWTEVYERLKAQEAPKYPDITKELAILPKEEVPDKEVVYELA